jgi:NitT/TauT family transport system ATP-binding protein/taurine transport system ATP-binding protein
MGMAVTNLYVSPKSEKKVIVLNQVELQYVAKSGGFTAIDQLDLTIDEGEFVVILGPSGCGKTSVLKLIAGYENPTSGSIEVDGHAQLKPNVEVGVVFQHANLFPWLTVRKNVGFALKMLGKKKSESKAIVDAHLREVGLTEFENFYPHQLSGGMKQRAAIARSLVANPKVLLMDEPFGALDALTREALQKNVRELWKKTGKTIVFITHDVDEALMLGTRIIVMGGSPGKVIVDRVNPVHRFYQSGVDVRKTTHYADTRESLLQAIQIKAIL